MLDEHFIGHGGVIAVAVALNWSAAYVGIYFILLLSKFEMNFYWTSSRERNE